ncbi:MAG: TIGR00266 family protein [Pseudobdellovibrio sp.]
MEVSLQYGPSGTIAICKINQTDTLQAEAGAFMAMKGPVQMLTTTRQRQGGGILQGLKRVISGESFFINKFTALQPSEVYLGTPLPGDILVKSLNGEKIIIQGGSYIASGGSVNIDLEWQGLKTLFSGESLLWVKAQGQGQVILGSFGFIYPIQVDGEYIVDSSHIVAFEETLTFSISKAAESWLQAFLSGEGFVCKFKGKGTVWCQSHSPASFGQSLRHHLRPRG